MAGRVVRWCTPAGAAGRGLRRLLGGGFSHRAGWVGDEVAAALSVVLGRRLIMMPGTLATANGVLHNRLAVRIDQPRSHQAPPDLTGSGRSEISAHRAWEPAVGGDVRRAGSLVPERPGSPAE